MNMLQLCEWVRKTDTTGPERATLHAIAHHCDTEGKCWPSLATLAREAGIGVSTLARALNRLEDGGLVMRTRRQAGAKQHRTTLYELAIDGSQLALFGRGGGCPTAGQGVVPQRDKGCPAAGQEADREAVINNSKVPSGPGEAPPEVKAFVRGDPAMVQNVAAFLGSCRLRPNSNFARVLVEAQARMEAGG